MSDLRAVCVLRFFCEIRKCPAGLLLRISQTPSVLFLRNLQIFPAKFAICETRKSPLARFAVLLGIFSLANFANGQVEVKTRFSKNEHSFEKEEVICYVSKPMVEKLKSVIADKSVVRKSMEADFVEVELGSRYKHNGEIPESKKVRIPLAKETAEDSRAEQKRSSYLDQCLSRLQELEYLQKKCESLIEKREIIKVQLQKDGIAAVDSYYKNVDEILESITRINKHIRFFEMQFGIDMKKLKEGADGKDSQLSDK